MSKIFYRIFDISHVWSGEPKGAKLLHKELQGWADVFSLSDNDPGFINVVEHQNDIGQPSPMQQALIPVPHTQQEEVRRVFNHDQMLQISTIEHSNSIWVSPMVLVCMKSGQLCPCIDFWCINSITRNDSFPLPKTRDTGFVGWHPVFLDTGPYTKCPSSERGTWRSILNHFGNLIWSLSILHDAIWLHKCTSKGITCSTV